MLCFTGEKRSSLCYWGCPLHRRGSGPFSGWHRLSKQAAPCPARTCPPNQAGRPTLESGCWGNTPPGTWGHAVVSCALAAQGADRTARHSEGRRLTEVLTALLALPQVLSCGQTSHRAGVQNVDLPEHSALLQSVRVTRSFWLRRVVVLGLVQSISGCKWSCFPCYRL